LFIVKIKFESLDAKFRQLALVEGTDSQKLRVREKQDNIGIEVPTKLKWSDDRRVQRQQASDLFIDSIVVIRHMSRQ